MGLRLWWYGRRLRHRDPQARIAASEWLARPDDAGAVQPLVLALGDPDQDVRKAAALALAQLGQPQWETYVRGDHGDFSRLAESDEALAVRPLLRALHESDWVAREEAAKALGQLGDRRAVKPLIRTLRDAELRVRSEAVTALRELGDRRAVKPLGRALRDNDRFLRRSAAEALATLGDRRAYRPLLRMMQCDDLADRVAAAQALGDLGNRRAVRPLLQALSKGPPALQMTAATGLGQLGAELAVDSLIDALSHRESGVRHNAALALGKLGAPRSVDPLARLLSDKDASVGRCAAQALRSVGYAGDAGTVDVLCQALRHGRSGPARRIAGEMLITLYTDPDLPAESRAAILDQRDWIESPHRDVAGGRHEDNPRGAHLAPGVPASDCMHLDQRSHADEGIGLAFPAEPGELTPPPDF